MTEDEATSLEAEAGIPSTDAPERGSAEQEGTVDVATLEEVEQLKAELSELSDKHLRLAAEFNNYRRRTEQERLGVWGRAQADLIGKLLEILDDLERVAQLDLSNATVEGILEGVDLVERKFARKLEDVGVEVIEPGEGDPFDPERMEAVMRAPAEREDQDDSVALVMQKGYALAGTLVRPARVAVYKRG